MKALKGYGNCIIKWTKGQPLIRFHTHPSILIRCIKIEAFAIRPLVLIVPPGNRRNVAGVHLGWFLPPFIKGGDIEETPALGVRLNTEYIRGMAKTDKSVRVLLNIDRVVQGQAWTP